MAEETAAEETAEAAEADGEREEPEEEAPTRRSGPGFIRGLFFGALAGAIGAALFAPPTGEEPTDAESEQSDDSELGQVLSRAEGVVSQLRSRVREAAAEGREAANEAEAKSRARYKELTEQ